MLLDKQQCNNIVKLDEGYYIFRTIRNSPAYFETKKKDVMAMVRQLSIPTIFFSLSAADTKWTNLLISLAKLLHNVTYTKSDIENMTWEEKCTLISSHPAACARYFHNRVQKFFKYVLHSPHSPFGHLEDFFYRIEFQHRGSPHVHGLLWIKGAPKFDVNSDLEVCAYIDSIIACTSNVSEEEQPYVQFQKHHHSKTCYKKFRGKKVCRFGAPWPPMTHSVILRPLNEDDDELNTSEYKIIYDQIQTTLTTMKPESNITFDDFLQKLGITEEVYILALQSSIHKPKVLLKREVQDIYINCYMKGMLSTWCVKHDVQLVLEAYSCIVYICDYMTKSHKGMSELLANACQEAKDGNMTLKESVRHMGNKFLNGVETAEQECCWDLLELPMTQSSVKVEFISTCPPDDRVFIAKNDAILQEMSPDCEDIKVAGNIDRYAKRPSQLEEWCLADYVAQLDVKTRTSNTVQQDIEDSSSQEDEPTTLFPIHLGNNKILYKRRKSKIIRFVNYKQKLDPENYYRERLLLYTAWRHEETDLYHGKQTYAEAFDCMKNMIQHKMAVYEPMAQILREPVEVFENEQISREYDDVAPSTQHEETQHELLETRQSESFEFFDPDRPLSQQQGDIAPQLHLPPTTFQHSVEIIDNIMSDEEYRHHIRSLNKNQYEFFSHIMNVATKKDKQELCWLNGGAGTGKSHLLKALYQGLYRICCTEPGQNRETNKVLIMAPTGKAAFNV